MFKYCLDRHKTQEICNKAVDVCLSVLKFVPDWVVTNKMIEKLDDVLFSNDDIVFVNEDSDNVIIFSDELGLNTIYVNDDNLDDDILVKMILKLLFMLDLWLGVINMKNARHVKKI